MKDFIWKGVELNSTIRILDAAIDVATKHPEEAQEFLTAYLAYSPHAKINLGYIAGYASRENAQKIFEVFDTEHPIFGRMQLSPEQIYKMGMRFGELTKTLNSEEATRQVRQEFGIGLFHKDNDWHVGALQ